MNIEAIRSIPAPAPAGEIASRAAPAAARLGTACPHCRQALRRVHRHFGDRLLGLFVRVRRYRCTDPNCAWEGLMRGPLPRPEGYLPQHLLDPARDTERGPR